MALCCGHNHALDPIPHHDCASRAALHLGPGEMHPNHLVQVQVGSPVAGPGSVALTRHSCRRPTAFTSIRINDILPGLARQWCIRRRLSEIRDYFEGVLTNHGHHFRNSGCAMSDLPSIRKCGERMLMLCTSAGVLLYRVSEHSLRRTSITVSDYVTSTSSIEASFVSRCSAEVFERIRARPGTLGIHS